MPRQASDFVVIQTAFGISPADPSLPRPLSAGQPLRLPAGQCAPHLLDCAQPPRWPAPAPLLPPHPRQANVHSEILSFPAVAAALWRVAGRRPLVSAVLLGPLPPLRSAQLPRSLL